MAEFRCTRQDGKVFASLANWKRHMSEQHGGYMETEVLEASGGISNEAVHVTGESSFEQFASGLPDTAAGLNAPKITEVDGVPVNVNADGSVTEVSTTPAPPQVTLPPRLTAEMKKIKQAISQKIPRMIFNRIASEKGDHWKLSRQEEKDIGESFEMILACLGIDFQIAPMNYTITSPLWLLLYPLATLLIIVSTKQTGESDDDAEQDNRTDSAEGERKDSRDFKFD